MISLSTPASTTSPAPASAHLSAVRWDARPGLLTVVIPPRRSSSSSTSVGIAAVVGLLALLAWTSQGLPLVGFLATAPLGLVGAYLFDRAWTRRYEEIGTTEVLERTPRGLIVRRDADGVHRELILPASSLPALAIRRHADGAWCLTTPDGAVRVGCGLDPAELVWLLELLREPDRAPVEVRAAR